MSLRESEATQRDTVVLANGINASDGDENPMGKPFNVSTFLSPDLQMSSMRAAGRAGTPLKQQIPAGDANNCGF